MRDNMRHLWVTLEKVKVLMIREINRLFGVSNIGHVKVECTQFRRIPHLSCQ